MRATTFVTFLAMAGLSLATSAAATEGEKPAPDGATTADERAIYDVVLSSWLADNHDRQMVDRRLRPAPSASESAECIKGVRFSDHAGGAEKTLDRSTFGKLNVELVDGDKWQADDPQKGISRGQSVDDAVKQAFAHSLVTFSQVALSDDGKDALVSFSMRCGSLCGHGFTLHLHKSGGQWKEAGRCGGYVS